MDVGPVRLFGAVETPRGRRCRAYWKDGTLYVMQARDKVDAYEVPERPVEVSEVRKSGKLSKTWEAVTADGEKFSITQEGCATCGFTLMAVPSRSIPARVEAPVIVTLAPAQGDPA